MLRLIFPAIGTAKRAVVTHVGPEPAGPGLALGQDRYRGVVGVDAFRREDMALDRIDQWHQGCRGGTHPVCEGRDIEVDAFAMIDLALTVEWQVQAILGEQDMGQQPGSRTSTRNRVRGGRRLADRFAGPADELLTDVLDHLPLARE